MQILQHIGRLYTWFHRRAEAPAEEIKKRPSGVNYNVSGLISSAGSLPHSRFAPRGFGFTSFTCKLPRTSHLIWHLKKSILLRLRLRNLKTLRVSPLGHPASAYLVWRAAHAFAKPSIKFTCGRYAPARSASPLNFILLHLYSYCTIN